MTLDKLRPLSNKAIRPFVAGADRLGVTPNMVTTFSVVVAALAGYALYLAGSDPTWYLVGAALVLFTGFLDVLDGALARETGLAADSGDFLDHVLDRYGDVVILAGFALGADRPVLGMAVLAGVLLTAYLGTQGHALDLGRIYGGLLGRADILVLVGTISIVAAFANPPLYGFTVVEWGLIVLVILSHITALQRFYWAWEELAERERVDDGR